MGGYKAQRAGAASARPRFRAGGDTSASGVQAMT